MSEKQNIQDQLDELQVLQSIYGDDIEKVVYNDFVNDATRIDNNYHHDEACMSLSIRIRSLIERHMVVHSYEDDRYHLFQTGLVLRVELSSRYPSEMGSTKIIVEPLQEASFYYPPEVEKEHESFVEQRKFAEDILRKEVEELQLLLMVNIFKLNNIQVIYLMYFYNNLN